MAAIDYGLTGSTRDAFTALNNIFATYGLGTLGPKIATFLRDGYSADTIGILLQSTSEYKQRFAANAARQKAGLPVLSPAEYLATEKSYRQIMSAAGLPVGFYDQPADFQKFLEQDISPTEVQQRVQTAADFVHQSDPAAMAEWKRFYGTGDAIAFALDPKKAASLIDQRVKAAEAAGAAKNQGLSIDQTTAEDLGRLGVTADQARQGFSLIAGEKPQTDKLAQIDHVNYTTNDLINETFKQDNAALQKREGLASRERARFGGNSSTQQGSLARGGGGQL